MVSLNMKKILSVILLFVMVELNAQPDWQVNPADFEYSMSVTGTPWLNGEELDASDATVGAFLNDVCIGVATPGYNEQVGRTLFYMTIFGNSGDIGNSISFKLYGTGNDITVQGSSLTFQVDAIIGAPSQPFLVAEPALETGTEILSFDLGADMVNSQIGEDNINICLTAGEIPESLTVDFTLSDEAMLFEGDMECISGTYQVSTVDPVPLQVWSQGMFHIRDFTVTINRAVVADAGSDELVSESNGQFSFINQSDKATALNYSSLSWTHDGSGELLNDTTLTPIYNFSTSESSSVIFTLSAAGFGSCGVDTDSMTLTILSEQVEFIATNILTPNGDGYNDTWLIFEAGKYNDFQIDIFNEEGKNVFSQVGYDEQWDGYYKGSRLPIGTYWYVVTDPQSDEKFRGYITLIY